jgi:tetratricopeptide (TPR) repeat protein
MGDRAGVASALVNTGLIEIQLGRTRAAAATLASALTAAREISARRIETLALCALGGLAELSRRGDEARRRFRQSLAAAREMEHTRLIAESLVGLGRVLTSQDREDEARGLLEEALTLARESGYPDLRVQAACELARGSRFAPERARELLVEHEPGLSREDRLRAHHTLWRVSGAEDDRRACREILDEIEATVTPGQWESMRNGETLVRVVETDLGRSAAGRSRGGSG